MSSQLLNISSHIKCVVFIGGPVASGKSSVTRRFANRHDVYIENVLDNPHFDTHSVGQPFNAFDSQNWFIDQIIKFLASASTPTVLVEQHPLGICKAYSSMLRDAGLLTNHQLQELLGKAAVLDNKLKSQNIQILNMQLSATTSELVRRAELREVAVGLSYDEIDLVNSWFQKIIFSNNTVSINTEVLNMEDQVEILQQWIASGRIE